MLTVGMLGYLSRNSRAKDKGSTVKDLVILGTGERKGEQYGIKSKRAGGN